MKTIYEKMQKFQSRNWQSWETKALHHLPYILCMTKEILKSSRLQKQLLDKSVNLYHPKTELNHVNERLFLLIHILCWEII